MDEAYRHTHTPIYRHKHGAELVQAHRAPRRAGDEPFSSGPTRLAGVVQHPSMAIGVIGYLTHPNPPKVAMANAVS